MTSEVFSQIPSHKCNEESGVITLSSYLSVFKRGVVEKQEAVMQEHTQ